MTDNTEPEAQATVREGDGIRFHLLEGRRPRVYADTFARIAYASNLDSSVITHIGAIWMLGYLDDGTEALELEDGTVVALEDLDPDSVVLTAAAEEET